VREAILQLRGDAGPRQVEHARTAGDARRLLLQQPGHHRPRRTLTISTSRMGRSGHLPTRTLHHRSAAYARCRARPPRTSPTTMCQTKSARVLVACGISVGESVSLAWLGRAMVAIPDVQYAEGHDGLIVQRPSATVGRSLTSQVGLRRLRGSGNSPWRSGYRRLASFARVVLVDRRGTGPRTRFAPCTQGATSARGSRKRWPTS
jgi:hypothetical protein